MARLGLSSPWVQYYHQLEAFFKKDSDIKVVYDEENNDIKIYVADPAKADALTQILPYEKSEQGRNERGRARADALRLGFPEVKRCESDE